MGAYRVGHGELVPAVGRLRPTSPGYGSDADRAARRAYPAASPVSYRRVEAASRGAAPGCGGWGSAATAWGSRAQAGASAGSGADLGLRPGGQGPQHGWPGRGGQPARGLRWPTPFWQAIAPAPTWPDDPDSLYGTLVWHLAGAGRTPAAPHPVSVLEPHAPPGEG